MIFDGIREPTWVSHERSRQLFIYYHRRWPINRSGLIPLPNTIYKPSESSALLIGCADHSSALPSSQVEWQLTTRTRRSAVAVCRCCGIPRRHSGNSTTK
jgi:hypothetical protein